MPIRTNQNVLNNYIQYDRVGEVGEQLNGTPAKLRSVMKGKEASVHITCHRPQ